MIKSFRLRLALLSVLLTGLALLAFGLGTWWLIRDIKIERIDSEVRSHAERAAARPLGATDWREVENRFVTDLGIRDSSDLLLLVQNSSGGTIYQSSGWPSNLDPTHLAWPKQQAGQITGWTVPKLVSEARATDFVSGSPLLLAQAGPGPGPGPGGRAPPPDRNFFRGPPPPRPDAPPIGATDQNEYSPPRDPPRTDPVRRPPDTSPNGGNTGQQLPPQPMPERQNFAPSVPIPSNEGTVGRENPLPQFLPPRDPPGGPPPVSSTTSQSLEGSLWRIGLASTDRSRIAVAVNARVIDADMNGIRNAFFAVLPLTLILIGFGGWIFSSRALRPLRKLTDTTRKVTAEGLNNRIAARGEDHEFVELIEVFNRMLERLERSFKQAHRFSADAAHELKTPLAILQGQLERAINTAEDGSPLQAELTGILDEVRRLSTISRKLLMLSQADAGRLSVHREPCYLSKTLADLVEDTRMLAPQLQVSGEIQPDLLLNADEGLLRQVLHNLISNAIKYNVEHGWITITASRNAQRIEVMVSNSSPGIIPADRVKIFERFYRADPAHTRHIEGVGLGLSVSREIARAHGGDITLKTGDDGIVRFTLALPAQKIDPKQKTVP